MLTVKTVGTLEYASYAKSSHTSAFLLWIQPHMLSLCNISFTHDIHSETKAWSLTAFHAFHLNNFRACSLKNAGDLCTILCHCNDNDSFAIFSGKRISNGVKGKKKNRKYL
jgi:hypothetical protein